MKDKYPPKPVKTVEPVNARGNSEHVESKPKDKMYLTQQLSKYKTSERKLVSKIYTVIKSVLDPESADKLVMKIQEELMK